MRTRQLRVQRASLCGIAAVIVFGGPARAAIDFAKDVQPILEMNCVACHSGKEPAGELDLTTLEKSRTTASGSPAIEPGRPDDSTLYTYTILERDDGSL